MNADVSLMIPFMPARSEQLLPYAALVHHSRAERLWQGQALVIEPHQSFGFLAGAGFRIPVGTGVTLMPFRHPVEAALQARSMAATMGERVVAAYGPGGLDLQAGVLGRPWRSQLGASREYLTVVRQLLTGRPVDHDGEHFRCRLQLPPADLPLIELGLGVLRPGMARLAGEIADVAVTWMTPAPYLREVVVPALEEGARTAGRPRPRVVVVAPTVLASSWDDPVEVLLAGNLGHLRLPHYQDMLRRAGVDVRPDDLVATARSAVDAGVLVRGDPGDVQAGVQELADAGADEVVLNMTGLCGLRGSRAVLDDLAHVLTHPAAVPA